MVLAATSNKMHQSLLAVSDDADTWQALLALGTTNPDIFPNLDFTRIWLHVARLLGAKNPEEFKKKNIGSQVVSDEQAAQERQAGNIATPAELEATRNLEEV